MTKYNQIFTFLIIFNPCFYSTVTMWAGSTYALCKHCSHGLSDLVSNARQNSRDAYGLQTGSFLMKMTKYNQIFTFLIIFNPCLYSTVTMWAGSAYAVYKHCSHGLLDRVSNAWQNSRDAYGLQTQVCFGWKWLNIIKSVHFSSFSTLVSILTSLCEQDQSMRCANTVHMACRTVFRMRDKIPGTHMASKQVRLVWKWLNIIKSSHFSSFSPLVCILPSLCE